MNIMIAGVGGQGTVLASKLIAAAAIKKGFEVLTAETIGMAQRGGSVVSHVRIAAASEKIFSPLISLKKADALIAFEPAEAVRQLPYLSPHGTLIVCDNAYSNQFINYLKQTVSKLILIDTEQIKNLAPKTLNVMFLGAAAQAGIFPFDAELLKEAIPEILPKRFVDMNLNAFITGMQTAE